MLGSGPNKRPDDESDDRDQHHGRHEPCRDAVGQPLDRRARALRLGDHLDDAGEHGFGADLFGSHHQRAVLVERAGDQPVAVGLLDRHGLAGEHRFVDRGTAFEHDAVDRDAVAGADAQAVAGV